MVYYPNIPTNTEKPAQTQPKLSSNFTDLDTVFNDDHVGFSQAIDRGEHRKVTINSVIADPGLADPKCSLYIKTVAGDSELFFEKYDNTAAANLVQQMTNLVVVNPGLGGATDYGVTTPWGLIINWGTYNTLGTSLAINFAVAFVGTPIVTLGREDNVVPTTKYVSYRNGTVTNLGFTVIGSAASFAGSYIAIGV